MNVARPWHIRLRAIALISLALFAVTFSSCSCGGGTGTTSSPGHPSKETITICAADTTQAIGVPNGTCGTGAYAALRDSARVIIQALDPSKQPLANQKLSVTIRGPNAGSASVTTDSSGKASYSYQGTHLGSDTVTASPTNGVASSAKPGSVVVEWIPKQATTRPIIWVHGIHEDATDFAHEIHGTKDQDQVGDGSEQTWTSLLGALTTTYDPSAIQAFCYVDDFAWTNPMSGCPGDELPFRDCAASSCVSESSVDQNALALAKVVQDMHNQNGHKVTLMAYSMGGAIVRTLMAGCRNSPSADQTPCEDAAHDVDHVFLLNAAQEGSWLLTGASIAGLEENGLTAKAAASFLPVLPLIRWALYAAVQAKLGLRLAQPAIADLTPASTNIQKHNTIVPPPGPDFYTFYGDISLSIQLQYFTKTLPPQTVLPLGDLVFLPQADALKTVPAWGGSALCDQCSGLNSSNYQQSPVDPTTQKSTYHEWALANPITIPINGLVPLLSAQDATSSLQLALNAPVQHLNISQPASQDFGSTVQVKDITGLSGGPTTNMSNEIYLILAQDDGLE